jgi:hypothetical protein
VDCPRRHEEIGLGRPRTLKPLPPTQAELLEPQEGGEKLEAGERPGTLIGNP